MEPLTIVLIILLLTIIAFMSGKMKFSVISICIIVALIQTKVLTITEAFSGFTNKKNKNKQLICRTCCAGFLSIASINERRALPTIGL